MGTWRGRGHSLHHAMGGAAILDSLSDPHGFFTVDRHKSPLELQEVAPRARLHSPPRVHFDKIHVTPHSPVL